ncbi:MAG: hypothetical protein V4440_10330 [Pseudomonadota bacterium]
MKYLILPILLLAGCTSYNVKIQKRSATDTWKGAGPIITCKSATMMDEGGVCYDYKGCSDGKDHLKSDDGCEYVVLK